MHIKNLLIEGKRVRIRLPFARFVKVRSPILFPSGRGFDKSAVYNPAVIYDGGIFYKINEKYWMYFGESNIWIATSEDLIDWSASKKDIILRPRRNRFDSRLVEPGSPSIVTDDYILLIYNSANYDFTYHVAWAAFSKDDPTKLIARAETPLLSPEFKWELEGQVDNVWFAEGLVYLDDIWYLYFGGTEHILDLQKLKLRH